MTIVVMMARWGDASSGKAVGHSGYWHWIREIDGFSWAANLKARNGVRPRGWTIRMPVKRMHLASLYS